MLTHGRWSVVVKDTKSHVPALSMPRGSVSKDRPSVLPYIDEPYDTVDRTPPTLFRIPSRNAQDSVKRSGFLSSLLPSPPKKKP